MCVERRVIIDDHFISASLAWTFAFVMGAHSNARLALKCTPSTFWMGFGTKGNLSDDTAFFSLPVPQLSPFWSVKSDKDKLASQFAPSLPPMTEKRFH